jgi:hypothetical protein
MKSACPEFNGEGKPKYITFAPVQGALLTPHFSILIPDQT